MNTSEYIHQLLVGFIKNIFQIMARITGQHMADRKLESAKVIFTGSMMTRHNQSALTCLELTICIN